MSNKDEKAFMSYFMGIAKPLNYYRTSLTSGSGFPDVVGFHGSLHSLIELKDLVLGKKGDRLLKQFFEPTQPPWYLDYINRGGLRLFVVFRIRNNQDSSKWYGLLKLTPDIVMRLARNELRYTHLEADPLHYKEFDTCIEMVKSIEHWRES